MILKIKKIIIKITKIPKILTNIVVFYYRLYISRDEYAMSAAQWFKDKGDDNLRLNYPLNNLSCVIDVGGFKGDFAYAINKKFECFVYVYEPVEKYYLHCVSRFKDNPKIKCFNCGLSDSNSISLISDGNDGSSIFRSNLSTKCEKVMIRKFADELNLLDIKDIDLIKINIEGGEFLLVPHIISEGIINRISNIQIQFHNFYPEAKHLRNEIRCKLSKTHKQMWNYPFVWESWTRL